LSDDGKAYHRLLETIDGLKAAVEKLQASVTAASEDFGKALDGVNAGVDSSAQKVAGTLEKINDTVAGMDRILADIRERGLVSVLDAPGQVEPGQVKRVLDGLESAIKDLREAVSKLPPVLDDGSSLVKGGQQSLRRIDSLSIAARRHWLLKGLFGKPEDGWLRATDPGPEAK
jgi:ABC-type transporter Mla subunit MlaD